MPRRSFSITADLAGATRGFANHSPAVNFVDPWPGGWWRLRDIVDYEKICARSLLTLAARYAPQFQTNLAAMARDSIKKGKDEPPYAWLVPADQSDPGRAVEMVRILHETGIEVERAAAPFQVSGVTHPAGTWILPAAQPYRAHLKDMMERQVYPRRLNPDGTAEPPYDVAGWTLPLANGRPGGDRHRAAVGDRRAGREDRTDPGRDQRQRRRGEVLFHRQPGE